MNVMSEKVKKVKLVEKKERRAATFKFTLTKENKEYLRTLETIVE